MQLSLIFTNSKITSCWKSGTFRNHQGRDPVDTCNKAYTVHLELRFIHIPKSVSAFTLHPHPPLIYGTDCRDHSVHVRSTFFVLSAPFSNLPHSRYSINYTLVSREWIQIGRTHFTCKTKFFAGRKLLIVLSPGCCTMCYVVPSWQVLPGTETRSVRTTRTLRVRQPYWQQLSGVGGGRSLHISFLTPSDCTLHPDFTNHLGKEEILFSLWIFRSNACKSKNELLCGINVYYFISFWFGWFKFMYFWLMPPPPRLVYLYDLTYFIQYISEIILRVLLCNRNS